MNNKLYVPEQHSESFKIWSAINSNNTEAKSLIIKSSTELTNKKNFTRKLKEL